MLTTSCWCNQFFLLHGSCLLSRLWMNESNIISGGLVFWLPDWTLLTLLLTYRAYRGLINPVFTLDCTWQLFVQTWNSESAGSTDSWPFQLTETHLSILTLYSNASWSQDVKLLWWSHDRKDTDQYGTTMDNPAIPGNIDQSSLKKISVPS